ncbi:MAG: hypothetical protein IKW49_03375 [Opitutales bacterium]|nr:hypothetical protein [Opitutales bacterium]
MPQLIQHGREMIRISPRDARKLEFSVNGGCIWQTRCISTIYGKFLDLNDSGNEILAQTEKGLYASNNAGRTWLRRGN